MKKISSNSTFFWKRIFPALWLGVIAVSLFASIVSVILEPQNLQSEAILPILIPVFLLSFGILFFYYLLFCLLDEVFYDDDSLLVVNKGKKTRIPFDEIQNIRYDRSRPPRIEVTLYCEDRELGKTLYFAAPVNKDLFTFKRHPDVEEFFEKFGRYKHS